MALTITFFDPQDVFGLASSNGWALQSGGNRQESVDTSRALGADGDEIAAVDHGRKEQVTCSYVSAATSGNLAIPNVGAILGGTGAAPGWHVDSVKVGYSQTGLPTLEVSGHKHLTGAADAGCRTYSATVTLPAQAIGVPREIAGVYALDTDAPCAMRSMSYTLTCSHVEEQDCNGDNLASDNHDGVETVEIEVTGVAASASDLGAGDGWHVDSLSVSDQSNTGAAKTSLTLSKHIAHD